MSLLSVELVPEQIKSQLQYKHVGIHLTEPTNITENTGFYKKSLTKLREGDMLKPHTKCAYPSHLLFPQQKWTFTKTTLLGSCGKYQGNPSQEGLDYFWIPLAFVFHCVKKPCYII